MSAHGSGDRAEVVVVGGGHNGLICAAYLARAGLDVCVVEKNDRCGGALFGSVADGVTLEHGGVDHSTIVASPIPEELELERRGLEYVYRTASAMHIFGDGTRIAIAPTAEQTAESIAMVDEADAEAWLRLADLSSRFWELFGELSAGRAIPPALAVRAGRLALGSRARPLVDLATLPAVDVAERWFRSPYMRALACFRSQFSGLPATEPGTGAVFSLTPAGHGRRFGRPKGGSRRFVESIEAAIEAYGGAIQRRFAVTAIRQDPEGWLVQAGDGASVLASRAVVSAVPPQTTILDLVRPASAVPRLLRRRLERVEVTSHNLSQFTIASALRGNPSLPEVSGTDYEGAQLWLLSDPEALAAHQAAAARGTIARRPAVLATFPSVLDGTAAPEDRASLWINGFIARDLRWPGGWQRNGPEAADRIWSTVELCLPGVRDLVTHSVLTTPADLDAWTGARNPGFHLSATLAQSLGGRPARGCADHRSGIRGIYLTGAGTNPGPGISGLPGRACAQALLDDLAAGSRPGRWRARAHAAGREWSRARNLTRSAGRARRAR